MIRNILHLVVSGGLAAVALMAAAAVARAELAPICLRGARAEPVSLDYILKQRADGYYRTVYQRIDTSAFDPEEGADWVDYMRSAVLAEAIEWPGVLADHAAELPRKAHDLPWLLLLAELERSDIGVVQMLTTYPQSILLPDLLPLMDRHGLGQEAVVLRKAMVLFPDWVLDPSERQLAVTNAEGMVVNTALDEALRKLEAAYPGDRRAEAAVLRLVEETPGLEQALLTGFAATGDEALLTHLITTLRDSCLNMEYFTPEDMDAAYLSLGTAQAALLMLDDLSSGLEDSSPYLWLDGDGATMAPQLLRVLDIRRETELATGLRKVMAEFPDAFPRDTTERWSALDQFSPETWERIGVAMPEDAYDRIHRVMLDLARDAGLLPG